jgi:hypothetical protein
MGEVRQETEDGEGSIEIQTRGEANGGKQREQFGGRDLQDVEHPLGRHYHGKAIGLQRGKQVPHRAFSPIRNDNTSPGFQPGSK